MTPATRALPGSAVGSGSIAAPAKHAVPPNSQPAAAAQAAPGQSARGAAAKPSLAAANPVTHTAPAAPPLGAAAPAPPAPLNSDQSPQPGLAIPAASIVSADAIGTAAVASPAAVITAAAAYATPAAQIGQALVGLTSSATRQAVTVQLAPDELGQIKISVVRGANGAAAVTVTAARQATLALVQADSQHLHTALDQAGIAAHGRTLIFSLAEADPQPSSSHTGAAETRATPPATAALASGTSAPDSGGAGAAQAGSTPANLAGDGGAANGGDGGGQSRPRQQWDNTSGFDAIEAGSRASARADGSVRGAVDITA